MGNFQHNSIHYCHRYLHNCLIKQNNFLKSISNLEWVNNAYKFQNDCSIRFESPLRFLIFASEIIELLHSVYTTVNYLPSRMLHSVYIMRTKDGVIRNVNGPPLMLWERKYRYSCW